MARLTTLFERVRQLRCDDLQLADTRTGGDPNEWDTTARRNSVASTAGPSALCLSAMSHAHALTPVAAPPLHVNRSRGPRLGEGVHAVTVDPTVARVPMN